MRRTLADWLDYQQRVHPRSMDFTLDRIRAVLERLGVAQPRARLITVGGTNGKGSVTAMLDAVLRAGGHRVGHYTSPHLVRYSERIRIDGREIDEERLLDVFERIEAARGTITLTFFEYATAAALLAFAEARLDTLVLEVGLGGRLDAVNAVDPDVAVVVSIGLDHCDYLGPTRELIGAEKAGIFRAGRPAIFGSLDMPASIGERASAVGARLERLGADFEVARGADGTWRFRRGTVVLDGLLPPALPGAVQYANAGTALAALSAGGLLPDRRAIDDGLRGVRLPGRFEVRPGAVEWVFDVAHNEDAAAVLADNVRARPARGRTFWLAGILRDKDADAIAVRLAPAVRDGDEWCALTLAGERGVLAADLAARLQHALGRPVAEAASVEAGCDWAASRARAGDRVLAFGSFHTVGPALEWHRLYSAAPR
jgi:dihydrofolate synthase / folylpolyglutamate synthase